MASHEAEVARHQVLIRRADERLAKRRADQDAEHQARLHAVRTAVSTEYSSKFKKQEERFQRRSGEDDRCIRQLEQLNATLVPPSTATGLHATAPSPTAPRSRLTWTASPPTCTT